MSVEVQVTTVAAQPTAVIAATTTWQEFAREGARPGRNVMLYRDDVPHVEVGVELPAGRVVRATLRDSYDRIGLAHQAVDDECLARGLTKAGPRWSTCTTWRSSPPASIAA